MASGPGGDKDSRRSSRGAERALVSCEMPQEPVCLRASLWDQEKINQSWSLLRVSNVPCCHGVLSGECSSVALEGKVHGFKWICPTRQLIWRKMSFNFLGTRVAKPYPSEKWLVIQSITEMYPHSPLFSVKRLIW